MDACQPVDAYQPADACQPVDAYQPAAKYLSIDGANNRLLINILLILIWRKHYTKYQFF